MLLSLLSDGQWFVACWGASYDKALREARWHMQSGAHWQGFKAEPTPDHFSDAGPNKQLCN